MAKYNKKPTEVQKKEWRKQARENEREAFERIKQVAEEYRGDPEKIMEYLAFASRFYSYSAKNIMLIYAQNPGATLVQSFMGWKDMGASPVKGATSIKILVPVVTTYLKTGDRHTVRISDATEEQKKLYQEGEIEGVKKTSFKLGSVFDISQTTFPKERYPELLSMGYSSQMHKKMAEGLIRFSETELKCQVTQEDLESIVRYGYYLPSENRIVLNHLLEDTMRLSTMSHELGHALVHCDINNEASTAQKEFEGDAVSVMLHKRYGIELTEQRRSHIAEHMKAFQKECERKAFEELKEDSLTENEKKEKAEEQVDRKLQDSFQNVFRIYGEHQERMEHYVDAELEKERETAEMEMQGEQKEILEEKNTKYGKAIRERREEKGITQAELAYTSMITTEALQSIETGRKEADSATLLLIANALGIYTSALEEGKIVEQSRRDIRAIMEDIGKDLNEIEGNNAYIKDFMETYGIQTQRYQVYPKETLEQAQEEVYVVFDTMQEDYIRNEDGSIREWEDKHDAKAYADNLNLAPPEIQEDLVEELEREETVKEIHAEPEAAVVKLHSEPTMEVSESVPKFGTR